VKGCRSKWRDGSFRGSGSPDFGSDGEPQARSWAWKYDAAISFNKYPFKLTPSVNTSMIHIDTTGSPVNRVQLAMIPSKMSHDEEDEEDGGWIRIDIGGKTLTTNSVCAASARALRAGRMLLLARYRRDGC
jgi:hypothetical protein